VRGWKYPETAARLAAAFALANEADNRFITYTPSSRPGVIILGSESDKEGLRKVIAAAKPNQLFSLGKSQVLAWLAGLLQTPQGIADLRGGLMAGAVDMKPDTLVENLKM